MGILKQLLQALWQGARPAGNDPESFRAQAAAHFSRGHWAGAAESYRRALALDPGRAEDWNRLGLAYRELGELAEACRCFDRAVQIAPDALGALANAASARRDLGNIGESLALFRRVRARVPDNLDVLSGYLFTLNLDATLSRKEIFREHLECGRLLGATPRVARQVQVRHGEPGRRLKIGYLSPDLRYHAVAFFVEPLLARHDRSQFEIFCYHLYPRHDAASGHLKRLSDHWTDCADSSDADIARRIALDEIDILVDLAGHTDGNRITVLAHRPAPVIATWLGYLNTTGLKCVDYRITDRHTDPAGSTEAFHTETLLRLPASQWCRQRPEQRIPVSPLPASSTGAVRFGSFNKSSKLTPGALQLWSRLLSRVPRSTLLFAGVEEQRRDSIREAFKSGGVDPARLEFAGRLPLDQFLMLHHRVDIALDAYPYSGATTTLDSLWMGVPVLTLAGDAPMSRSTASILATLDMHDWIAQTGEEFAEAAARLAADLPALAACRAKLRQALESSILMDGERFTRQLEELYRQMWRARAGKDSPSAA